MGFNSAVKGLISKTKIKQKPHGKLLKKKQIGNNNCQNDIKYLKINNTITNSRQEIANSFSDYSLTVAGTVFRNIKRDNSDSTDNVNPSRHLINKFNTTFLRIIWSNATTYENDKIIKSLKTKILSGYDKIPIKILKLSASFII